MKIVLVIFAILNLLVLSLAIKYSRQGKKGHKLNHKNKKGNTNSKKSGKKHVKSHMSFLATKEDDDDENSVFEDQLADEDAYDPTLKQERQYKDYNQVLETNVDEVMNTVKDDLYGEDVNYNYDD
jgi:hypothetical protein